MSANRSLSKKQSRVLKLIPQQWSSEGELLGVGVDRSSMLGLQSKGVLEFTIVGTIKMYRPTT